MQIDPWLRSLAFIAALVSTIGCDNHPMVMVNGHNLRADWWERAADQVSQRAAFDMNCAAGELELTVLNSREFNGSPTAIGVRGCGQQAVYVHVSGAWALNSGNEALAEPPPPPSQPPPQIGQTNP